MQYFLTTEFLTCKCNQGYDDCRLLLKLKYWQRLGTIRDLSFKEHVCRQTLLSKKDDGDLQHSVLSLKISLM